MNTSLFRSPKSLIAYGHDIAVAAISFIISLWLRLGEDAMEFVSSDVMFGGAAIMSGTAAIVFWLMGLYRGVWRYASVNDLVAIIRAAAVAILIAFVLMFLWTRLEELPRSIPIINWFVLVTLLGGPRFIYRIAKDRRRETFLGRDARPRIPVILVGASDGAELFIRAVSNPKDANYTVVGILAENPNRVGRDIHGVQVRGLIEDLEDVVAQLKESGQPPQRVIVTKDDIDAARMRDLFRVTQTLGLTLARTPRLTDFRANDHDHSGSITLREIAVEDLLGRPQKPLDRGAMRALIEGKNVMVTGAGGSIGAELVRQISGLSPQIVTLLDASEYALYQIDLELSRIAPSLERNAIICDVRDRQSLAEAFQRVSPEIVFHAAALKHVPLVEENPIEGFRTNIKGTVNVADLCVENDVEIMVQISTDKAVNPTNVMGASKRIAEQYIQALDLERADADETRFVTVRFGNVLGSTGSVVPLFREQLSRGGPLTVTHPEMTRYFMTIREAVELVLQAAAHGHHAERKNAGKVYVLDMGEPVKIVDLARQMIHLAGLEPEKDIEIEFTGIRPGEKLFEELLHDDESLVESGVQGTFVASPRSVAKDMLLQDIDRLCATRSEESLEQRLEIMARLVPEYERL